MIMHGIDVQRLSRMPFTCEKKKTKTIIAVTFTGIHLR